MNACKPAEPLVCQSRTPAYLITLLWVTSVSLALGPGLVELVGPVWLLISAATLPFYLWSTPRVTVTAEQVEIVNAFRTISVPLTHVIRLEPAVDSGLTPHVVVTAYGEFGMARLGYGRDPGTRDEEAVAAILAARSGRPGKAPGAVAQWRRRRLGVLDWVVAVSAVAGAVVQVWLMATGG